MEENTIADSISVGVPRNADKALMAIRESNGIAVNVTDEEILAAQRLLGRTCGVFGEPAGVTGAAALKKACEQGLIQTNDATVVSVVTGNGLKDVANAIKSAGEPIHIEPDLDLMVEEFKKRGVTVEYSSVTPATPKPMAARSTSRLRAPSSISGFSYNPFCRKNRSRYRRLEALRSSRISGNEQSPPAYIRAGSHRGSPPPPQR